MKQVLSEAGRATGVEARRADGSEVRISAPLVVVAAGAVPTPPLLRRSGLGRHPRLGRNLSIHPAIGITAGFEERVVPWSGVMQSVGIEELHESEGVLIEATGSPPGMGAISAPGYGTHLLGRLDRAADRAMIGAMIADEPSGRVFGARAPLVSYRLAKADEGRLADRDRGNGAGDAGGGRQRMSNWAAARPRCARKAELEAAMQRLDVRRLRLAGFHPTGTAAAGSDPGRHPVDPEGRLRGVEGVWVADGSILPSCPGVNPQVSIMAIAIGVGEAAASDLAEAGSGRCRGSPGPERCHSTWPSPSAAERPSTSSHSCSIALQAGDRLGRVGGDLGGQLQAPTPRSPRPGATRLTRPSRSASSAPTVREESSRYLAVARPQRVTRRAGPTGTPSAAPGKRMRRLEPPTRMSQATAISAPPPTTSPWQAAIVGLGKATIWS